MAQATTYLNQPVFDRQQLINTIIDALPRSLNDEHGVLVSDFVGAYYQETPLVELSTFPEDDLAGMALSHWKLAKSLGENGHRYHVINPSFNTQGWHSSHTVIQIVAIDQPWLVSSLQAALARSNNRIHCINHPIIGVRRNDQGQWLAIDPNASHESFIQIEIDAVVEDQLPALSEMIDEVFETLAISRTAEAELRTRLGNMADTLDEKELSAFVRWLDEEHFTPLGAARLTASDQFRNLHDACGVLKKNQALPLWQASELVPDGLGIEQIQNALADEKLLVCKAGRCTPVIRNEPADLIIQIIRDESNKLIALECVVGVFIIGLQNEAVSKIPWMHQRVNRVIEASGKRSDSHVGKAIAATLRSLPREMLLQTRSHDLLDMVRGIVSLQERRQVRLFHTDDRMGRFSNCLVFIPRDAYSRDLRLKIEQILIKHTHGISSGFDTYFSSESPLARLHFVIEIKPPYDRAIDWPNIEQSIRQASVTWDDKLESSLLNEHDEITAMQLHRRYTSAFPPSYRERYSARSAVADIDFIETELPEQAPVMSFYRQSESNVETIHFKLFKCRAPVSLSEVIPVIENMGLRVESENPFEIRRQGLPSVWMHEFTVHQTIQGDYQADAHTAQRVQSAFNHIWRKDVENDGFNRLMLDASLNWRQVVVLRALCKYLLQIGVPFSQDYMIASLVGNASITRQLVKLFEFRFKPVVNQAANDDGDEQSLLDEIDQALDQVVSLDEDRILRSYRNLIMATLRTNAFRQDEHGQRRNFLSFKFDSARVPELPLPRPQFEIFVYSASVEGIHLRGGPVARGGLRWSDRREDFRTEVLGLMKAQMVKNAVIVPVGSKGGFYVKASLPDEREPMMEIVVDCYKTFLSGLLDITDNLDGKHVLPPPDVVRYDADDPYLVVAADKGTASFSDYANEVSQTYGFWLGDAFASGGSVGYDHKKMGITARGAWESVKRHFRNLGINTQKDTFTVIGIGDMAGDVFGNGMLLSNKLKLVAAFNHQHIFIDPSPDCDASFNERKRLFELPRSSWTEYDNSLISEGGGVFSRQAKIIELSVQARDALGITEDKLTPNALINAVLKAPVDLLWNGGIGTYVKSCSQTHADAADRANDAVRVNGNQLRVKVVGEGGNLGLTQLGRIEFARNGGLIYTDAIDNSAGVDCSDHEVNIKILANALVTNQDLTLKQRDQLLESMTDDVARLVLQDNYLQTQCIDLCAVEGQSALNEQSGFIQHLESINRLDRSIEYLPDSEEIAERLANNQSLLRPEIAVLVSYSKMVMFDELMDSELPADPALESVLCEYFPSALQKRFPEQILTHRLRSEIIATLVTNDVVNRLGPTFAFRMHQELNASASDVAAAFVIVREIFGLSALWADIEVLDNQIDASEQYRMQLLVRGLVERATHWLIRTRKTGSSIQEMIERYQPGLQELIDAMPACLSRAETITLEQRVRHFSVAGVPDQTATAVAKVVPMSSSLDIVEISRSLDQSVAGIAAVYFALGQYLELSWLRERIGELVASSHWHKLATSELRSDLHYQQRHLCAEVASATEPTLDPLERVSGWAQRNAQATEKYNALITDMKASTSVDFAMLSLAINEVHKLLQSVRPLAG
ncbi:MAG: NAD-glutamate dehydrogenase [Granulosicoccus sp.]|nr:NAD-glutamate dehydrogenase [Granulosicoccus sp.]